MTVAAITATFSDWKLIKTRGVVQLVFEVPIENADTAYQVMGGMPAAATERWFAIARLNSRAAEEPRGAPQPITDKPAGARRPVAAEKRLAQQAGILCSDPVFQQFLLEQNMIPEKSEEQASTAIRLICGVTSRAEIIPNSPAGMKWNELSGQFEGWKVA